MRWTLRRASPSGSSGCARGLLGLGLEAGDRVGLWSPNYAEWTLLQYATAEIGVVLVNVNPAYRTHELAYALDQSGCRMLFAAPSFKTSDYVDMVEQVTPELPGLERAVFFWEDDWDELVAGTGGATAEALAERRARLRPDDPINIQYTSGTTGFPKGATLTHRNILNNGYFVARLQGFEPGDRLCIPVPFYHCFGMVMGNLGCTTHGATMVIPSDAFEPTHVLETVAAERCTALYGVPTMFIAELAHPEFDALRPVEPAHRRDGRVAVPGRGDEGVRRPHAHDRGDDLLRHDRDVAGVDADAARRLAAPPHGDGRAGPPARRDPRRRPDDRRDAASGARPGEFCTRGYSVMQGYWNDAERTAEAIDADGWMHTGDLAVMADDGYVNIVGRIKDMVIRGGENVYPREVEEFLYTHPDVEDVQVIGVPDERYGEELMAWVRLRRGADVDAEALREFCQGKIAHFKIPRYVKFVDEFPMTVTGKVQKFKMREQSIAELGLQPVDTA